MMELTSASANKLVKSYNERIDRLYRIIAERKTYIEVEGSKPIIPDFSYNKVQAEIEEYSRKVLKLKHAINVFNSTTDIPDIGFTIDNALVRMAQLSRQKQLLSSMCDAPERKLNNGYSARNSGQVEYECLNYDTEVVAADYEAVCLELYDLQIQLDLVNNTVRFKVDIEP